MFCHKILSVLLLFLRIICLKLSVSSIYLPYLDWQSSTYTGFVFCIGLYILNSIDKTIDVEYDF